MLTLSVTVSNYLAPLKITAYYLGVKVGFWTFTKTTIFAQIAKNKE
jgi:hypothetical protein